MDQLQVKIAINLLSAKQNGPCTWRIFTYIEHRSVSLKDRQTIKVYNLEFGSYIFFLLAFSTPNSSVLLSGRLFLIPHRSFVLQVYYSAFMTGARHWEIRMHGKSIEVHLNQNKQQKKTNCYPARSRANCSRNSAKFCEIDISHKNKIDVVNAIIQLSRRLPRFEKCGGRRILSEPLPFLLENQHFTSLAEEKWQKHYLNSIVNLK